MDQGLSIAPPTIFLLYEGGWSKFTRSDVTGWKIKEALRERDGRAMGGEPVWFLRDDFVQVRLATGQVRVTKMASMPER